MRAPPRVGRSSVCVAGPASAPHELTPREVAVLRLISRGLTNRQIGAELFISPGTAAIHVSHILRKLGVAGQVEAAGIAHRLGLVDAVD